MAFYDCAQLERVVINEGVVTIGASAFNKCPKLNDITVPDSAVHIMERAFDDTGYYLNAANWTDKNALYIGRHLYKVNCFPNAEQSGRDPLVPGLTVPKGKFTVKNGTYSLAATAFSSCDKITEIVLPEGLKVLENYAMAGCTSLAKAVLPTTLKYAGMYAFHSCKALKELAFPQGMEYIGEYAFQRDSFSKLLIPASAKMESTTFVYTSVEEFYYGGSEQDLAKFNFRTFGNPPEAPEYILSPGVKTYYHYTAATFPVAVSTQTPAATPRQAVTTATPEEPTDVPEKPTDVPEATLESDGEDKTAIADTAVMDSHLTAVQDDTEERTTGQGDKSVSPVPFVIGGGVLVAGGAVAAWSLWKKKRVPRG